MATGGSLVANLLVNSRQFGSGLKKGRNDLKSFVSFAKKTLLPLGGLIGASMGARASIDAGREQIAAEQKLAAVLKATGHAAGLSARQIKEFAASRQDITNFGDEATIAGAALLATFKEIKGDIFKDAIVSAQDMSAVMGQDLKGSIVQLGKALNDPIRGVSALTEVGVSFTQSQKDQIRALQESGDMLGAQSIILKELQGEFGGAAEAMADPLMQWSNLIGDIGENISYVLLPVLKEMYNGMKEGLGVVAGNADAFKEWGSFLGRTTRILIAWTKNLLPAAIAIGVVSTATYLWHQRNLLAAKSTMLLKAMSGPSGWATLAAGVAIYAGSLAALNATLEGTTDASQKATVAVGGLGKGKGKIAETTAEVERLKQATQGLADMKGEVRSLFSQFADSRAKLGTLHLKIQSLLDAGAIDQEQANYLKERAVESTTGIISKIKRVKKEIALLKGQAKETDFVLAHFFEKGAPAQYTRELRIQLDTLAKIKKEVSERKEKEKAAEEQRKKEKEKQPKGFFDFLAEADSKAKALKETLISPLDLLKRDLTEIETLFSLGKLTRKERDQLIANRQKKFDETNAKQAGSPSPSGPNTALDAGSTQALALFARAVGGSGTVSLQERSLKVQNRIEEIQRKIAETLARQEQRELKKKPEKVVKLS